MGDLEGRRVLVSGAAGGLGIGLCVRLAMDGARVLATDLDSQRGQRLFAALAEAGVASDQVEFVVLDQSSEPDVVSTMERVRSRFGAPDTLINNAAIYPSVAATELPFSLFEKVHSVNVGGAVALVNACIPHMKAAGFGRIVNVSSITFDTGYRDLSAYVATKGALVGLTRVWAREFGASGITVNAVSPGAFPTDAEKIHPDPEKYSQFVLDQQAIKRRGAAADFAGLVAFLIGADASFITGQTIRVDGGWMMA